MYRRFFVWQGLGSEEERLRLLAVMARKAKEKLRNEG